RRSSGSARCRRRRAAAPGLSPRGGSQAEGDAVTRTAYAGRRRHRIRSPAAPKSAMKTRTVIALLAALAVVACREHGRPDPNIRMAASHEPTDAREGGAGGDGGDAGAIPTRLEVPPDVQAAYSGLRLRWKDKQTGKEGVVEVPLGGGVPLPDPTLVV